MDGGGVYRLYLNSPALVGLGRPPGPGQPGQAQGSLASPTDSLKPEPFASCGCMKLCSTLGTDRAAARAHACMQFLPVFASWIRPMIMRNGAGSRRTRVVRLIPSHVIFIF